jgi:CRP-like cAMP-binding protein
MFGNIQDIVNFLKAEAPAAPLQHFEAGEHLCQEGEACLGMHLIEEGLVVLQKQERWLKFLKTGDLLGITCLNDHLHSASAKALEAVSARFFPKDWLYKQLQEQPGLHLSLMTLMCQELNFIDRQISIVSSKDSSKKVGNLLLSLHQAWQHSHQEKAMLIDDEKVARWNGISTRLLKQVLKDFEHRQWIRQQRNQVLVLDEKALNVFVEK